MTIGPPTRRPTGPFVTDYPAVHAGRGCPSSIPLVTPVEARAEALRLVVAAAEQSGRRRGSSSPRTTARPPWSSYRPRSGAPCSTTCVRRPRTSRSATPATGAGPNAASRSASSSTRCATPRPTGWCWSRGRARTDGVRTSPTTPASRSSSGTGSPTARWWRPGPTAGRSEVPAGAATATVEVAGVAVPTLPLMALPTAYDATFPIDVVYTWVDGDDPEWNAARQARGGDDARPGGGRTGALPQPRRAAALDAVRAPLRAVGAAPSTSSPPASARRGSRTTRPDGRVRVVDHREILPPDALPTFNSQAIETALHRVPGLAEHFVYLNDDVFLGRRDPARAVLQPRRRRRGVRRRRCDRAAGHGRQAVPARGGQQPGADRGGLRRRDHPGDGPLPPPAPGVGARRGRGPLRRRRRPHRPVAVPRRDRRLDAVLAGPALRAGHRDGVRRRPPSTPSSTSATPGSSGSCASCAPATGTSSASATTTSTPSTPTPWTRCCRSSSADYFPVKAPWER